MDWKIIPVSGCSLVSLSILTSPDKSVIYHISSSMFKKMLKYSKFKTINTLKLINEYVEITKIDSNSVILTNGDKSIIISDEVKAQLLAKIFILLDELSSKYNIDIIYHDEEKGNISFSISNKSTNVVMININILNEYLGIVKYYDKNKNISFSQVDWTNFSDLSEEFIINTLFPKIETLLNDSGYEEIIYYANTINKKHAKYILGIFSMVKRQKYCIDKLELVIGDDINYLIEDEIPTEKFYSILNRVVKNTQDYEPVYAAYKYTSYVNRLNSSETYFE